jgi:dipeptidyl aminopeptidase/acylaminoacyl peptidase
MNLLPIFRWPWLARGVLTLAILVGTVAGGLALWGVPAPPAIKTEDAPRVSWRWVWHSMAFVRKAQEARRFAGWLPGRMGLLVHVGTPGAIHIVEQPGAAPVRVPGLPDRARHVVQSRLTERPYFVFSVDEGGSERYLHYLYDLERETSHALTTEPARSHVGGFDREGRRMLYASASRNQRDMDLYIVDVTNPASHTRLFDADGQFSGILSPDGREALVTRSISHSSVLVYLLDLDDRSMRPLFGSETAVGLFDAAWSRDGRTLYVAADLDGEFAGIYAVDPRTGTRRLLTPALEWDVEDLELMSDDRTLAVLVNINELTRADEQPAGDVTRIVAHPSARTIALDATAPAGLPGVWVYDLDAGRATPWAASSDDAAGLGRRA